LNIIIPLILWINKRNQIKKVNRIGKDLLNFQITWTIAFYIITTYWVIKINYFFDNLTDISPSIVGEFFSPVYFYFIVLYTINLISVVVNSVLIGTDKKTWYYPRINSYDKIGLISPFFQQKEWLRAAG
jgi:uncharacterized Tic20 family protein